MTNDLNCWHRGTPIIAGKPRQDEAVRGWLNLGQNEETKIGSHWGISTSKWSALRKRADSGSHGHSNSRRKPRQTTNRTDGASRRTNGAGVCVSRMAPAPAGVTRKQSHKTGHQGKNPRVTPGGPQPCSASLTSASVLLCRSVAPDREGQGKGKGKGKEEQKWAGPGRAEGEKGEKGGCERKKGGRGWPGSDPTQPRLFIYLFYNQNKIK